MWRWRGERARSDARDRLSAGLRVELCGRLGAFWGIWRMTWLCLLYVAECKIEFFIDYSTFRNFSIM